MMAVTAVKFPHWDTGGAAFNSRAFATLEGALAEIGAANATILLAPGDTKTLTGNLTIPANVTLSGQMGVIATNGFTLTVNGKVTAGPWPVFDTSGGGSVVLGSNVDEVWAEWWGLNRDGLTDDKTALFAALTAADGRRCRLLEGSYLIDNGGVDFQTPTELAVDVWLAGEGVVTLKSQRRTLPLVGGGNSPAGLQRNILYVDGATRVRLENVVFDGQHDLSASTSGDDVAFTYRQALLEVRNTTRVELIDVRGTNAAPVYSADSHGGAGEDDVEAWNQGLFFLRGCDEVYMERCGIKGESWWEGWEVMECGNVQCAGFYSEAGGNHYTPFNCWGPNTKMRFDGLIKNSPGSAIGVGGQDADIHVDVTLVNSGGVNLTRLVGASETSGFRTAVVNVHGSDLQESSHGFAVKAGDSLDRSWDGSKWVYPYGSLTVRGSVDGCMFGVFASDCRNVDVDMTVRDPVNVAAHSGHVGIKGKGHYIRYCGSVRLRGLVDAERQLTVDAVACSPDYGYHVYDCTHLDANVDVRGSALTVRAVDVECSVDGVSGTGARFFRSCIVAGTISDSTVRLGASALLKLNAVDVSRLRRYTGSAGLYSANGNWASVFTYRVVPIGVTAISVAGGAQSIPSGATTQVTLGTLAFGYSGDVSGSAIRPRQRGRFLVSATARLTAVPAGTMVRIQLYKNGAAYRTDLQRIVTGGAASDTVLAGSAIVELNGATDTIDLRIEQTSGGALTLPYAYLDCTPVMEPA